MPKEKDWSQSISANNSNISGNMFSISEGDSNQIQVSQITEPDNSLNARELLKLIVEMQNILKNADIPDASKSKCLRHLQTVIEEVEEEEPDKEFAAQTLKKLTHVLKETGIGSQDTNVLNKLQPIITRILPWMGEAKKFLVL